MTVTSTLCQVTYTGDGLTQAYVVPFEAMTESDVYVWVDGNTMSSGMHFNYVGNIHEPGSSIVFVAPPANGAAIEIRRLTRATQDTEYSPYGPYRAEQVEADFDRAMMLAQEERLAIDNPPPIVFPTLTASQIRYVPGLSITATEVQSAIEQADLHRIEANEALVPKVTPTFTHDPDTLTFQSSDLSEPLAITTRVNVPGGLLKLDGSGHIPPALISTAGINYVGVWSVGTDGATPPGSGNTGDMYIFEDNGTMQLREAANPTPHSVPVFINDYMVWTTDPPNSGWYYVHNAQPAVITATQVTFVPSGTIVGANVQAAINELDASISLLFTEENNEAVLYRRNASGAFENVLRSSADGIRLLRANQDKFGTNEFGVTIRGANFSTSPTHFTQVELRSLDGIVLGRLGFIGDSSMNVVSDRPGSALGLSTTMANGARIPVMTAIPGETNYFHDGGGGLRAFVNGDGLGVFSRGLAGDPNPTGELQGLSSDYVSLYRIGFLGTSDFYIAIDRPGSTFKLWMQGREVLRVDPTSGAVFMNGDLGVNGQVGVNAPAPTAPSHLTRKDYVDSLLQTSGFVSPDLAIPGSGTTQAAHNLGVVPTIFGGNLVCVTSQAGYVPGDLIAIPHLLGGAGGYSVAANATYVAFVKSGPGVILPAAGGGAVSLIESSWRVRMYARK